MVVGSCETARLSSDLLHAIPAESACNKRLWPNQTSDGAVVRGGILTCDATRSPRIESWPKLLASGADKWAPLTTRAGHPECQAAEL